MPSLLGTAGFPEKAACCLIGKVPFPISSKLLIRKEMPALLRYVGSSEKAACCLIEEGTSSISSKLLIKEAIPALLRYSGPPGEGSLLPDRECNPPDQQQAANQEGDTGAPQVQWCSRRRQLAA